MLNNSGGYNFESNPVAALSPSFVNVTCGIDVDVDVVVSVVSSVVCLTRIFLDPPVKVQVIN